MNYGIKSYEELIYWNLLYQIKEPEVKRVDTLPFINFTDGVLTRLLRYSTMYVSRICQGPYIVRMRLMTHKKNTIQVTFCHNVPKPSSTTGENPELKETFLPYRHQRRRK